MHFRINSPTVNLEVKYIWYKKLFNDEWMLATVYSGQSGHLNKIAAFLNEKYHFSLHSLLDLDLDKAERDICFG